MPRRPDSPDRRHDWRLANLGLVAIFLVAIAFGVLAATSVIDVGGGGHGHGVRKAQRPQQSPLTQPAYRVRLPNGQVVIQAHSPQYAEPRGIPQRARPRPILAATPGLLDQYDSTEVGTVPRSAHYVAGYVDGRWPTYRQLLGHWPVVVGISVRTADGADCFDMEPGNPGPWEAGPWASWQISQGNDRPCEYSMLSWMQSIRFNLSAYGIRVCTGAGQHHCVRLWDADWTYVRHLDAGYAGTQYTDHAFNLNLDGSAMAPWFYSSAPPRPKSPNLFAVYENQRYYSRSYGWLNERLTAEQFSGAWQHRGQYRNYLRGVLSPRLAFLAHRIAYVAIYERRGWAGPPGHSRGVRFQLLIHASQNAARA